jgi:hypothetical protein
VHFWISWSWVMMCVSTPCFDICLQVHSGAFMFHHLWQCCRKATPSWYYCTNCMHIFTRASLCSSVNCFGTHLAQILWYPRSLWIMKYADPQLLSNLLAVSVTVICLPSWTRALTHTALSAVREVVRWLKWSSSMTLVLPLLNLFTHWYIFLCAIQFSLYCANILLWILECFPPVTTKI